MQSLAGAIPARGLHLQKTQPPHAETMVCGGGYGLFLDAVAEGDFFFSPAGAAAGGVFDVSTVGVALLAWGRGSFFLQPQDFTEGDEKYVSGWSTMRPHHLQRARNRILQFRAYLSTSSKGPSGCRSGGRV